MRKIFIAVLAANLVTALILFAVVSKIESMGRTEAALEAVNQQN